MHFGFFLALTKIILSGNHFGIKCDVKYVLPADWVISNLPDYQVFSRQYKLRIDPQHIPDLKGNLL